MNERTQIVTAIAQTLIQLHPNGHLYVDTPAEVATAARRYADAILSEMAKINPKTTPEPDQAADDEAWFWGMTRPQIEAGAPERWAAICKLSEGAFEIAAEGPTIAAAIRALRDKVKGGAR